MKRVILSLIRGYQRYLSPMKRTKCPYIPSCSAYGAEAVRIHGAFFGSLLALWRILRCNPFSSGGFDPVPAAPAFTRKIVYQNRKRK
ncbi:MAG: membrane protein insertion efficiency factor YidD [Lachnospiraceae bacterium]|nr:membrane protein insertion efficiency factor YidD [Lachnospiraceae bacterium]